MNLFVTTFESVAVLLGIGIVGFWIIKKRVVPGNILGLISPLAIDIALPSLILTNIISNFSPKSSPDWWQLPLWWLGFTGASALLTRIAMYASHKSTRREFGMSLFYQNGIFFPLAILAGMFGDDSPILAYLFLFTLFYPAFFFSTYTLFFEKKETKMNWKKIFNPVLIMTLIAVSIRILGVHTYMPNVLLSIFSLLAGMTIPLIMIILGGTIYLDFNKKSQFHIKEIIKFLLIKNICYPLIFLGILIFINPHYNIALIILLQSAVPPLTAVPLFTERAGGNRAVVNQFIVASFIFSLVTIPIMVSLFSVFFTQ